MFLKGDKKLGTYLFDDIKKNLSKWVIVFKNFNAKII